MKTITILLLIQLPLFVFSQIDKTYYFGVNGKVKFTDFQNGVLKRTGISISKEPLLFESEVTEFDSNGNKKSISVYKNNELVWNKNWLENGHISGIRIEKGINNMLDK